MSDREETVFAAFRDAVFRDHGLLSCLRQPRARDAYVTRVVAVGAEYGFVFDEVQVRTALREGEMAWLMQGVEVVA